MAKTKMSPRRKLAIASWRAPREGNIYGKLTLDATEALRYLDWVREDTGVKVTITHLVGAACGRALRVEPSLNGHIRMGRFVGYDTVDISFLVQIDNGRDLAQVKVARIDEKPITEVATELRARATKLRAGEDDGFEKSKGLIKILPTWILRHVLAFTGFLTVSLGIGAFGQKGNPFGSCIITSVGMLGVDEGFVPPTPFCRVPLFVAVTSVRDLPAVVDGKVEVRPLLIITATVDHRFVDGVQAASLSQAFREVFANPWTLSGLDGPPPKRPVKAVVKAPAKRPAKRVARKAT